MIRSLVIAVVKMRLRVRARLLVVSPIVTVRADLPENVV